MSGRRRGAAGPPSPIKGPDFDGRDQLTSDDWKKLVVTNAVDAPRHLYADWPGKLVGYCAATLTNDNASILNMQFMLAGSLWERPLNVSATRFFEDLEAGTSLTFPTFNTSALVFNSSALVSDYLSHEQIPHEWKRNGQPYPPPAPNKPFSIRAFVTPIEGKWARLWILLFPLAKPDLLSNHPLAANKSFPGMEVSAVTFPLGFDCQEIIPNLNWGAPILPIIVLGADWEQRPTHPTTASLKRALAATLRTATKPEIKKDHANLMARWSELLDNGEAALKIILPPEIWPDCTDSAIPRGKFFAFRVSKHPVSELRIPLFFVGLILEQRKTTVSISASLYL